ncbi:hypothetical protein HO543_01010 [Streptococcus suis]|nr:hypothetical protein [Streptococcus suis]NQJ75955.1 hypothetical protein [Streptococcus suis]
MKSTNRKERVSALTKLQKFLTFIGSILGIVTACISIYTFSVPSNAATTTPSGSVTTVSSTNRGHTSSINQIGENKSVTIPSSEISSPNEEYNSSTTENIGSLDDTETSSNQEIQTSTTTSNSTESSTETTASSSEE